MRDITLGYFMRSRTRFTKTSNIAIIWGPVRRRPIGARPEIKTAFRYAREIELVKAGA